MRRLPRYASRNTVAPFYDSLAWRERYNPLPDLTPERTVELYCAWREGRYADVMFTFDALEEWDDTLGTLVDRRLSARGELDHSISVNSDAVGDDPSSRAAVELQKSKSRVRVRLQDGKPHLFLSIRTQGEVRELTFEGGAGAQLDQLTEIQNAVAGQVKATVRHTIDKVLFENKSDVFRYSEFICKYLPDYWKANQQRWEQVIDDCTVDISVECIIDHPGLETSHRHP